MFNYYHVLSTLAVIAASATVLRASIQPNATALDRICDGAALVCLALLLAFITKLIAAPTP